MSRTVVLKNPEGLYAAVMIKDKYIETSDGIRITFAWRNQAITYFHEQLQYLGRQHYLVTQRITH